MRALSFFLSRFTALSMACVLLLSVANDVRSAPSAPAVEYRLKAAYLYNFTKFVEWPADATARSPFLIGVIDPGGSAAAIIAEVLEGKFAIDGRPIVVRHFTALTADAADCHQLFLTRASGLTSAEARSIVGANAVLLVGETDDFAAQGGVIGLVVSGDAVRCEVNLAGAQRARIKLSGRLAGISRLVRENVPPP